MKTRIGTALVATVALLAAPAISAASLPSTHSTSIVPSKSIGGVKLGMSLAQATKAWGKGGTCSEAGCQYQSKSGGFADFSLIRKTETSQPVVGIIVIETGTVGTTSKRNYNTPLARWKTSSGIGLGSTVKQLRHAYPQAKKLGTSAYQMKGSGGTFTTFFINGSRIMSMNVSSQALG
ncbi:MAG TPA: hypothetical protein VGG08_05060 [Solirubrobacteraceae bacterium]|jgi:hypothetical protein